jgi:hypothetical protein
MNPHKSLIEKLNSKNYNTSEKTYDEDFYTDNVFGLLEDESINNLKGGVNSPLDNFNRFKDIISDPNNLFINRVDNAGTVENGTITLHNGIKLSTEYYGNFIEILKYNLGVHEPSEERAFQKVLTKLDKGSIMIELGSYWSMYSIWFMKTIEDSISYCIEPDANNMRVGIKNFEINELKPNFIQGKISKSDFNPLTFFLKNNLEKIDILHSDIQGYEVEMLDMIQPYLSEKKIKYLFISTHSNPIHYECISFLKENGYKILCSCDFDNESFQYDGFILSCPDNLYEIEEFKIGNRSKTELISNKELNKIINNKL